MTYVLPYPEIKKIGQDRPQAKPETWNATYRQIDANFAQILGDMETLSEATPVVARSDSRPADIAAGADYAVPVHKVGSGQLVVFVEGLRCFAGVEYTDVSETVIRFTSAIPKDFQIVCVSTGAA